MFYVCKERKFNSLKNFLQLHPLILPHWKIQKLVGTVCLLLYCPFSVYVNWRLQVSTSHLSTLHIRPWLASSCDATESRSCLHIINSDLRWTQKRDGCENRPLVPNSAHSAFCTVKVKRPSEGFKHHLLCLWFYCLWWWWWIRSNSHLESCLNNEGELTEPNGWDDAKHFNAEMQFNLRVIKKSGDISVNPPSHTSTDWIIHVQIPRGQQFLHCCREMCTPTNHYWVISDGSIEVHLLKYCT